MLTCLDWAVFSVMALIQSLLIRLLHCQTENTMIRFVGCCLAIMLFDIMIEIIGFKITVLVLFVNLCKIDHFLI